MFLSFSIIEIKKFCVKFFYLKDCEFVKFLDYFYLMVDYIYIVELF